MWQWKGKGFVIPAVVFCMVMFLFKNLPAGQDEYGRTPVADNLMGVSENNQENEGRQGLATTVREDAGSRRQAVRQRMAERRGGRCRSNENGKGMDENTVRDIPADQGSQPSGKNDTNLTAPFQSPDWMYEAVDESKGWDNCYQRTIALDADNHPHLAYGGDHLYHAWYDGGNWWNETVDSSPNVGAYASLAIDTAGHAHISYFDSDNKCLKYTTNTSGKWITAIADGSGTVIGWTSLSLDAAGHAHISYIM